MLFLKAKPETRIPGKQFMCEVVLGSQSEGVREEDRKGMEANKVSLVDNRGPVLQVIL